MLRKGMYVFRSMSHYPQSVPIAPAIGTPFCILGQKTWIKGHFREMGQKLGLIRHPAVLSFVQCYLLA